ncbi:rod shape-determining protein MreD [Streptococcus suis]
MRNKWFPILLLNLSVLIFLLDGQLALLYTNFLPGFLSASSYLLFFYALYVSLQCRFSQTVLPVAILGFLFDIYYLDLIGVATVLFPVLLYFVYYFSDKLSWKFGTLLMMQFVMIFFFEMIGFLLARVFSLSHLSIFIFLFYHLLPTLIINTLIFIFIYPWLGRFFSITVKT